MRQASGGHGPAAALPTRAKREGASPFTPGSLGTGARRRVPTPWAGSALLTRSLRPCVATCHVMCHRDAFWYTNLYSRVLEAAVELTKLGAHYSTRFDHRNPRPGGRAAGRAESPPPPAPRVPAARPGTTGTSTAAALRAGGATPSPPYLPESPLTCDFHEHATYVLKKGDFRHTPSHQICKNICNNT